MVCLNGTGIKKRPSMKDKKDKLAQWLYRTGLLRLLSVGCGKYCIVINYHRIRQDNQENFTLFDDEVFGPSRSELDQHFHWLKRNMDVISEDDLLDIACDALKSPARGVLITFDDGYVDNYTLAYPLLRGHGLPAIFFIPTQAMEERTIGWWDHVAYLLKMTQHETIIFEGKEVAPKADIQQAFHYVLSFIDYNRKDVDELLLELSAACDVELPDAEIQGKELMTWENLREVSRNGIGIGAHTHSHKILSSLDLKTQKHEMIQSKHILEKKLNLKVRSMSYPVGNYHHFTEDTKELATECGYELAFSFLTGINSWERLDTMNIRRISVSNYLPRFVGIMCMPGLFNDCE